LQINKLLYSVIMALVLLVPGSVMVSATTDFNVFVVATTVHDLGLKAIQMQNGQIVPTSNFAIAPESVVQVKQGENLAVITSTNEPERIEKVKVSNSQGQVIDLVHLQNGQYSLSGLNVGVYALNVIANTDKGKNAYETILILLAPYQKPIEKTEINKIIQKVKVSVRIDFDEKEECRDGYSYNNKTNECEKINICIAGLKHTDKGCQPLPKPGPPMPPTPEPTDKCFPISAPVPEECEDVAEDEVSPDEEDTPIPDDEGVSLPQESFGGDSEEEEENESEPGVEEDSQFLD
jgi:hypothetical protein